MHAAGLGPGDDRPAVVQGQAGQAWRDALLAPEDLRQTAQQTAEDVLARGLHTFKIQNRLGGCQARGTMLALALLVLRLAIGLTLAAHGAQKVFGWFGGPGLHGFHGMLVKLRVQPARPWSIVGALSELVGGLLVALGLLGPIGPALGCGAMLVAIVAVHWPNGFFASRGGLEFPGVLFASLVALALAGFGDLSLDHALGLRLPEPAVGIAAYVIVLGGACVSLVSRSLAARREVA